LKEGGMERRAKKGKKEAFIKFWVRSSPFKLEKREGVMEFIGPCILETSLPNPVNKSILNIFFISVALALFFIAIFIALIIIQQILCQFLKGKI
jgi:hypothetical protein